MKFRHTYDPKNMGEIEFHHNDMARRCGIDVPDFKLVDGKYFATRRFDIERLRVGDGNREALLPTGTQERREWTAFGYTWQQPVRY